MTTILYSKGVIAADRLYVNSLGLTEYAPKLYDIVPGRAVVAHGGNALPLRHRKAMENILIADYATYAALRTGKFDEFGKERGTVHDILRDTGASMYFLTKDDHYVLDGEGTANLKDMWYHFCGTGGDAAAYLLMQGYSVPEAVSKASEHDLLSGGGVNSIDTSTLKVWMTEARLKALRILIEKEKAETLKK